MAWTVWAWQCPGGRTGISGAGLGLEHDQEEVKIRNRFRWLETLLLGGKVGS